MFAAGTGTLDGPVTINGGRRDNLTRAIDSGAKFSWLAEAKATLEKLAKAPADSKPKT